MTDNTTAERLKSFIGRIERLEEEKAASDATETGDTVAGDADSAE